MEPHPIWKHSQPSGALVGADSRKLPKPPHLYPLIRLFLILKPGVDHPSLKANLTLDVNARRLGAKSPLSVSQTLAFISLGLYIHPYFSGLLFITNSCSSVSPTPKSSLLTPNLSIIAGRALHFSPDFPNLWFIPVQIC